MKHRQNRGAAKPGTYTVLTLLIFALVPQTYCYAQSGEDIAKGLLRALIESQLDKSRRRSGRPTTELAPRPGTVTPQINQLRPVATSFARETNTLGAALRGDSGRSFEARRRLPDALRLEARAAAVKQRVDTVANHSLVLEDFRGLNTDWSTLAHQLEQCQGLSQRTRACVQRITALDAQYCSILGLQQQQFDHGSLARTAYALSTYVRDLTDDIQHTPQHGHTASRALLRELYKNSQQAEYLAGLAAQNSGFNTVVTEYQSIYQSWLRTEAKLTNFSGHSIARNMRRIRDSHKSIHQLLRLEIGIDTNLVLHLIHETDHELSQLFRTMTLDDLIALPDSGSIPEAADVLSGTVQNIDDLVHRNENTHAIAEAWAYVDESWNQFEFLLRPVRNPTIATQVRDIGESLTSLQQALGVTVQYDSRTIVNSASTLETLSERLLAGIQRWQRRPGQHDRFLPGKASQLIDVFHHIEQAAARGHVKGHLQECDEAIVIWQQLRPVLKTCDTAEREQFDHISATFTTEVIRLRSMLDSQ